MPSWLIIHSSLIIAWLLFWLLTYYFKLWRIGFPFNKSIAFRSLVEYLIPICWLTSSVLIGSVMYFLFELTLISILTLIVIPFIVLLGIFVTTLKKQSDFNKKEMKIEHELGKANSDILNWTKQFPFIKEENFDIQLFISNNKPIGKMYLYEINAKEKDILRKKMKELPSGVKLYFIKKNLSY
jgi:hypothetical protein